MTAFRNWIGFAAMSAALASSALACAPHSSTPTPTPDEDSASLAADGTDTAAAENDTQTLTSTLVAASGSTASLASVTPGTPGSGGLSLDDVGDGAKLFFVPSGCLDVVSTQGSTAGTGVVTYTFTNCAGPRGLLSIDGIITANYSLSGSTLTLGLTGDGQTKGDGLKINGAHVQWNATATITANAAARAMTWIGGFTGTTAGGRVISRTSNWTVDWTVGGACVTIGGNSQGNVTGKDLQITVSDYQRCKASCPEPGSEITIKRASTGATVDITYGDGNAVYTDAEGTAVTFVPLCDSIE